MSKILPLLFLCIASLPVVAFDLVRLGSNYGGWTVPRELLQPDAICVCAGAGEDISFDLILAHRYGCKVFIVDPTPRAVQHWANILDAVGKRKIIKTIPDGIPYELSLEDLPNICFVPFGLSTSEGLIDFYEPKDPKHVSHSINDLQASGRHGFQAQCLSLETLMKRCSLDHIDVLKLDIEGSECGILEEIVKKKLAVRCICVEFDKFAGANRANCDLAKEQERLTVLLQQLNAAGYVCIHSAGPTDMTFVKEV